jgi:hypothetical protein
MNVVRKNSPPSLLNQRFKKVNRSLSMDGKSVVEEHEKFGPKALRRINDFVDDVADLSGFDRRSPACAEGAAKRASPGHLNRIVLN